MSKERRIITPWAHLSIAFDLCDRRSLPLTILGDTDGHIARIWLFERFCRRVRMFVFMILVLSCAAVIAVVMLAMWSRTIANLIDRSSDFIVLLLQIWFAGWLVAGALTFVAGFLAAPWRLRARPFLLLHAERLRRRNFNPIPPGFPSRGSIKSRLVTTSLAEELLSPLLLTVIIALLIICSAVRSEYGYYGAAVFFIVAIVAASILRRKASRYSGSGLAIGLSLALSSLACPACQYSLAGSGPPERINRCPECGMRFPCRLPVNFPPAKQSIMRKLGGAVRRRFG